MKKIASRELYDATDGAENPLYLVTLDCGHSIVARSVPNERLLKAGMPDNSWISPEATVANCPVCLE